MPNYEYKCNDCAHKFTVFQKITDKPVKKCPKCDGNVERLISGGTGFILKGSGFYETDYKRKKSCYANDNPCENPKRCCQNKS